MEDIHKLWVGYPQAKRASLGWVGLSFLRTLPEFECVGEKENEEGCSDIVFAIDGVDGCSA
jgi:hypothetical protein